MRGAASGDDMNLTSACAASAPLRHRQHADGEIDVTV
jgi:hypothetical protein